MHLTIIIHFRRSNAARRRHAAAHSLRSRSRGIPHGEARVRGGAGQHRDGGVRGSFEGVLG